MLTILLLTFLLSLDFTSTAPAEGVSPFLTLVEVEALKLPEDSLAEDQILHQEVVQGSTIYRHVKSEKHGAPAFLRKASDEGKAVVVLQEGEDYLPACKAKRTFVVLRQSSADKKVYRAFYAYVRDSTPQQIEWDNWFPRGNPRNKALSFGFVRCGKSSMIPCKKELQIVSDDSPDYEDFAQTPGNEHGGLPPLPYNHPPNQAHVEAGNDYFCDLHEGGALDSRFTGSVIGALAQSMIVLSGAELLYKNEHQIVKEVQQEIKAAVPVAPMQGRTMGDGGSNNATTAAAAEKLVDLGRQTVAGGTLLFYAAIVKVGALAVHEVPPNELEGANAVPEGTGASQAEDKTDKYKNIGMTILKGFFRGIDLEDKEQPRANPNPEELMKETVAANLMAGRSVGETSDEGHQSGRGILSWITGKADIGTSSANGEMSVRSYKGVQRDGTVSGSKGVDNLNFAIDNAFGGTRKSAGQIFSENIVAGVYMPYGLVEDAGDALGGAILGIGKISDDRSYIDDILDKAMNVVAGAGGQVVDVVGDILGPIGLGGIWSGVSGFAAGTLGAIGGGIATPVLGIYGLVKMGAKALGIGGVIGMHGSGSRMQNTGGNQNVDRYTRPDPTLPQIIPGRKRRSASTGQEKSLVSITDVDLFSHMGWRTVDIPQETFSNASYDQEEPFIGFGNCIYKKPLAQEFESAKTPKELTKLYAQSLRVQCLKDQIEILNDLFSKGYLTLASDKTFTIPATLPILSKVKLSGTEINELSKAFEISMYTRTHALATKSPKFKVDGCSQSPSFLKLMSLAFLEEAHKLTPVHYVKLARNIAKVLKTAFTKSLQDFFRYKHCRKCQEDQMKETLNDCILLLALTDFVLVEQERSEFKSVAKSEAFDKWFTSNKESVSKKMTSYFI